MSVVGVTVTVGSDKPYLIVPAFSTQNTGGPNRPGLMTTITNLGTQPVFLGALPLSGPLNASNGYQLAAGATVTIHLANIDALYGTTLTGAQSVTFLQGWQ
jgi:hypothetical protein